MPSPVLAATPSKYDHIVTGSKVRVSLRIKDVNKKGEEKERIQVFEGLVIARKHGSEPGATITVRKVSEGVGVEKILPIHSPVIAEIELVAQYKVRRAKIAYVRDPKFKKKMKEIKAPSEKKAAATK
ncbi:MAG: 50S ribosomal protein L19 [Patescibacteria group bacterium]